MGTMLLICRLAVRDLQRRRGEAAMLLVVMMTAATALTLGLVLRGMTDQPFAQTRAATAGPDAVATAFPGDGAPPIGRTALADVAPIARARGVVASSGPYPVAFPVLRAHGRTDAVLADGRDPAPVSVDQPTLTAGGWVRGGGIVVERSFADALGIRPGDRVTLNGRPFLVAGVAVTAAFPDNGLGFLEGSSQWPNPGLVWVTVAAARSLATSAYPLGYVLNLKLADPAGAKAFADRFDPGTYSDNTGNPYVIPWQMIGTQDGLLIKAQQQILLVGSSLLALLAVASVAILAGTRMADQVRRVGLLKAAGGTPALVAAVLLAEHLPVAVVAAAAGLVLGRLAAPMLTSPGTGLLGTAGAPGLTAATAGIVLGVAVAVAALATFVPAVHAARTSTVGALADAPRQPRRRTWLIERSARLPVPLLLAARLATRRPRLVLACVLSIAVTAAGIVAVLFAHATVAVAQFGGSAGSGNPDLFDVGFTSRSAREDQVLLVVTIMLATLAAVNAVFITRAAVQDSRHAAAVIRALGATPGQLVAGLSAAQVIPALIGALLGIPAGFGLFEVASQGGSASQPPAWWLVAVVAGTVIVVAALTAVPARVGTRRPVAEVLQSEGA
jgi:putative ABC transport system permease protein